MKTVLVIGKTGQLARALISRAGDHGVKISAFGRSDCDLSTSAKLVENFAKSLPICDGIIIAAAYTAVDAAEDDIDTSQRVNADAPKIFAHECAERGIPLVHISTDYVFPGDGKTPLKPSNSTDPINAYGASKLAGEKAIEDIQIRAAILRTSWVFDGHGKNFMTTMLSLAQTRDKLNVVADQIGRPTYAGHLADACLITMKKFIKEPSFQGGTYHISGSGPEISWADFANAIFAKAVNNLPHTMHVTPIPSIEYPTPAKRPSYSVMDITLFETTFGYKTPDWQSGLDEALAEWEATNF